jgi:hypothetical protein
VLARAAVLIFGFTAVSRVLGFVRETVNLLVDRLVGPTQVEGTISALNYGFRLVVLPHGLIALALMHAAYPAWGSASGAEDTEAFRELVRRSLSTLALLLVPVAVAAPGSGRAGRAAPRSCAPRSVGRALRLPWIFELISSGIAALGSGMRRANIGSAAESALRKDLPPRVSAA